MTGQAQDAPLPIGDLNYLVASIRRRLPLMIGAGAAVVLLVIAFILTAPRDYTAQSVVVLDSRKQDVVDVQAVLSGLTPDTAVVETEMEVMRSRALAQKVAQNLKLESDPEFNPNLRDGKGLFNNGPAPKVSQATLDQRIQDRLLSNLSVSRVGTSYAIRMAYTSSNPRRAAQVANAYANLYVVEQLDAKFDATVQANSWLSTRLDQLRDQLREAEGKVESYKASHGLLTAVGTPLTEQEISSTNIELVSARSNLAEKQARLAAAAGGSNANLAEVLGSDVVKSLRIQLGESQRKLAELNTRYGPRHPQVIQAQGDQEKIQTQIDQETVRIQANLRTERDVAQQRVASLQGSVGAARANLASSNSASVELRELQRNAESLSTLYQSFLDRFKQTSASQSIQTPDSRVIAKAAPPSVPSFPRPVPTLAIGLMLGMVVAAAAGLLAELLDTGLRTTEAATKALDLMIIGAVPYERGVSDAVLANYVNSKPLSAFAEAFRNIRAYLMSNVADLPGGKIILITSALPNEGKSVTSASFARTLALAGHKTLLIDADVRRRRLDKYLPVEPKAGLVEVLTGKVKAEQAITQDPNSSLDVLVASVGAALRVDLFGSRAMSNLMTELRQRYDFIVIDSSPILPVAETRLLAPLADVILFAVRWRKTPRKAARAALEILREIGVSDRVVGMMTQVNMLAMTRDGYGDASHYFKAYRSYYVTD